MSIWEEYLSPQPIKPFQPTQDELNRAWDWIFRESGNPVMVLKIIRNHARSVRAKAALAGVYRRLGSPTTSEVKSQIKVPIRGK